MPEFAGPGGRKFQIQEKRYCHVHRSTRLCATFPGHRPAMFISVNLSCTRQGLTYACALEQITALELDSVGGCVGGSLASGSPSSLDLRLVVVIEEGSRDAGIPDSRSTTYRQHSPTSIF